MNDFMSEYQRWMDSPVLSEREWTELDSVRGNAEEIESRFFAPLEFGTAGLRGVMGLGINRMNIYVIRQATQGFAEVILAAKKDNAKRGVVICHDCRINSRAFAKEAAAVMAGNGIHVRLFEDLRPTPELSFAIRLYGAAAGINITASHNPKEYNGYKVYWSDGAQLPPDEADAVAAVMQRTDVLSGAKKMDYDCAVRQGIIEFLGSETDEKFLEKALNEAINPQIVAQADKMKIVYTPFHGAGYRMVPEALRRLGIKNLIPVPEQMVTAGSFPTVQSPNPENPEGFALAIDLAKINDVDLILGTDPDADRVGCMVRTGDDVYTTISGNQMGVLLLDYIITARKMAGTLPENAMALKTIVTTEMAHTVAEQNGIAMEDTFTGFKFMAEKIKEYEHSEKYKVLFSYEESYGYMVGTFVRDKDAVTASVLIAEMAAYYHLKGMTLYDALESLYKKYGRFTEKTISIYMEGVDGVAAMAAMMKNFRDNPPDDIAGVRVSRLRDYKSGTITDFLGGKNGKTHIVGSDVLYFELEDGTMFIVRPSGTEPKIKFYLLVRGTDKSDCAAKIENFSKYIENLKK